MKPFRHSLTALFVVFSFVFNASPCGPSYITPVFDTSSGPETPYENFAAGQLGIVKPDFNRSVLYAAYRYINGGGFMPDEQKGLISVWNAEFNNKDYVDTDIDDAVRAWIDKRKDVVGKEEKPPEIYAERNYESYDFFPNCTRNAFETATETLNDRVAAHGPNDAGVVDWVHAQDEVFENCASGKQTPDAVQPGSPVWLQKDRAYQIAAASFYSMDYEDAKRRFTEIAQDMESPWQETADYLVARTLIRQASLTKDKEKAAGFYAEAEQRLQKFTSGKFADSAEKMIGLIAYRLRPKERVGELGRKLSVPSVGNNFRQDLVDYTWLMDKLQDEVLTAEDKRREEEEKQKEVANQMTGAEYANRLAAANAANVAAMAVNSASNATNYTTRSTVSDYMSEYKSYRSTEKTSDDDMEINVFADKESWSFFVPANATDDEVIARAESLAGHPLSNELKDHVRYSRRMAYSGQFSRQTATGHQAYYGETKMTVSLLPDYLRSDELTEWLFVYPMQDTESYLFSLDRYKQTTSDLWLMTALSKADKNSTQLMTLLNAAARINRISPAWPTIAYHHVRLLLDLGKTAEAKRVLDDILANGDLTISARNSFLAQRLRTAETMNDFLTYSLRKPYGFDFDGEISTIQEIVDQEKSYYDPQNNDGKTKEQYEREVEDRNKVNLEWQEHEMLDSDTIQLFNDHFPVSALIDVERSPALPEYMRERFAIAIWTRAALLGDSASMTKIEPELARLHPEFGPYITAIRNSPSPLARQGAILYFFVKNTSLQPYLQDGLPREQSDFDAPDTEISGVFAFNSDFWWCSNDDSEYDETTGDVVPRKPSPLPAFLTPLQAQTVKAEKAKMKEIGDAPKYLGEKVLEWARRSPQDRRVPESLYIMYYANGWTKFSCGDNEDLHNEIGRLLKTRYGTSDWTRRLIEDEKEK